MPSERPNYCHILNINPFTESEYDAETLNEVINKRVEEWQNSLQQRGSSRSRHLSTVYLSYVPSIRATMANDVLRKSEFERARAYLTSKSTHLKRYLVVTRNKKTAVIKRLSQQFLATLHWDVISIKDLIAASEIIDTPVSFPMDKSVVDSFSTIRDVGFYTPVEFVNYILSIPGLNFNTKLIEEEDGPDAFFTSMDLIYSKKDRLSTSIPDWESFSAAIVKLHSLHTSKEINDLTLYGTTYRDIEDVFELLDQDSGAPFTADIIDNIISTMVNGKTKDVDLAISMLEKYCYDRGYPANFSTEYSALTLCPSCKALTEKTKGACNCAYCGSPVTVICPHCGSFQSALNEMCTSCSTIFSDAITEIDKSFVDIKTAISAGQTSNAARLVAMVRDDYPYATELEAVSKSVDRAVETADKLKKSISALFVSKHFYTLKSEVDSVLPEYPNITSDEEIGPRYTESCEAVKEADAMCLHGASPDGSKEDYISAALRCPDHPDAMAVLRMDVPEGPADGTVHSHEDGIIVSYSVPEDRRGMTFCIYRGTDSIPDVNSETVPTFETENAVWLDTEAEPGTICRYRIHSRRWGVLSDEYTVAGPAVLIREVTNVTLTPIEDGIKAEYTLPAGCRRLRVWRKESGQSAGTGTETEIIGVGDTGFENHGLMGMQMYSYLFVAEYGEGFRSSGTVFRAETPAYPDPVTDMVISWDRKDGIYCAKWNTEKPVILYMTTSSPRLASRATPLQDLDSWMMKPEIVSSSTGEVKFRLPPGPAMFIIPVIPVGETGIVGDPVVIANLRPIQNITRRIEKGMNILTFPWPPYSVGAVVECGEERIEIMREPDEPEGRVSIPMGSAISHSVSISAIYSVDGIDRTSSPVSASVWSTPFARVRYTVSATNSRADRKLSEITVRLSCPEASNLPRMIMVLGNDSFPLKSDEGEVVWTSEDPMILSDGSATGGFFLDRSKVDVSKMRLFFEDRDNYGRYRIIHPLYNRRD